MGKSRCKHASLINGKDGKRDCALKQFPEEGSRVDKLDHCQRCKKWVPLTLGTVPQKKPKPPVQKDCSHFSELSGLERAGRQLTHTKRWGLCKHPERVELQIAEVVCPCTGCGAKCAGYSLEE